MARYQPKERIVEAVKWNGDLQTILAWQADLELFGQADVLQYIAIALQGDEFNVVIQGIEGVVPLHHMICCDEEGGFFVLDEPSFLQRFESVPTTPILRA